MEFERLIPGESHVIFTPAARGLSTIDRFVDRIQDGFRANLCRALIQAFADNGVQRNSNKYGNLGDGIFELKPSHFRFPFFYDVESIAVITHGFEKKRRKTPRGELAKAKEVRNEWNLWRATDDGRIAIRKATARQRAR